MNKTIKLLVSKKSIGERLDVYLSGEISELTLDIQKLIRKNELKINDKTITSPAHKIKEKDKIYFSINQKNDDVLTKEN